MAKRKASVKQKYSFKANRYIPPEVQSVGAEVIGQEIEAVVFNGVVDKAALVERARPASAPLHPCFEWNDKRAGELYRQFQARNIVNVVTVEVEGHAVGAFPSVAVRVERDTPPRRENIRIENVLSDDELRAQKINEVLAKLIRLRNEYRTLNELAVVWNAIDKVNV